MGDMKGFDGSGLPGLLPTTLLSRLCLSTSGIQLSLEDVHGFDLSKIFHSLRWWSFMDSPTAHLVSMDFLHNKGRFKNIFIHISFMTLKPQQCRWHFQVWILTWDKPWECWIKLISASIACYFLGADSSSGLSRLGVGRLSEWVLPK
jgi:hypothetical protein